MSTHPTTTVPFRSRWQNTTSTKPLSTTSTTRGSWSPPKHVFREKLLRTDDVLEDNYTCPREFRLKIIKCYLRWAKREYSKDLDEWKVKHERWVELVKMHTRRGVFVKNFQTKKNVEDEEDQEEERGRADSALEDDELTELERAKARAAMRSRTHTVGHSGVAKIKVSKARGRSASKRADC